MNNQNEEVYSNINNQSNNIPESTPINELNQSNITQYGNTPSFNSIPAEQPLNNQDKKPSNKKIIIIIICIAAISALVCGVVFKDEIFSNKDEEVKEKKKDKDTKNENDDKKEDKKDEWIDYKNLEKYEEQALSMSPTESMVVDMGKISFNAKYNKEVKGTLDFTPCFNRPTWLEVDGSNGQIYMNIYAEFNEDNYKETSSSDASIFEDDLREGMEILYYKADPKEAYTNVYVKAYGAYWTIGVNIESRSIDESVIIIQDLLKTIVEYDPNAPTAEEFSADILKKTNFNLSYFTVANVEPSGIALNYYTDRSGITKLSGIGSGLYNSYPSISDGKVSASFRRVYMEYVKDAKAKELKIKEKNIRLYHCEETEDSGNNIMLVLLKMEKNMY